MATFSDPVIRTLIIDHYDSYTNNLLQLLQATIEKDEEPLPAWQPVIIRHDQFKWCVVAQCI
jgi:para-aminobenzoate synthetase